MSNPNKAGHQAQRQRELTIFFTSAATAKKRPRLESSSTSRFGTCPLCERSFPLHRLEHHAEYCQGKGAEAPAGRSSSSEDHNSTNTHHVPRPPLLPRTILYSSIMVPPSSSWSTSTLNNPLPPGLFLFPDFVTRDEEQVLLEMLDHPHALPPWKMSRFNGQSHGKRWGVHCNLRDRRVDSPEHALPIPLLDIVAKKLPHLVLTSCGNPTTTQRKRYDETTVPFFSPNEANAIDYRKARGDWLHAHVDDRKLSKEPIANLSLAGDCYMTYTFTTTSATTTSSKRSIQQQQQQVYKVWLPRRCLQVLTGPARYNYTHAIANDDLKSDRRVSITLRESPLSSLPASVSPTTTITAAGSATSATAGSQGSATTPKIDTLFKSRGRS